MELNLNSLRLKHIKRSESVIEALQHLGGKASKKELVQLIASSVNASEEIVQSDVKQVLRAAVVNGYIVRHGKNYLLSRSCRLLHTDSGNTRSEKKKDDMRSRSSSTFPYWWNRFWNRFITLKNRDDSLVEEQISSNDMHKTRSTELNKLDIQTSMNIIPSDQTDTAQTNDSKENDFVSSILLQEADSRISKPESSVPIQECQNNILLEPNTSDSSAKELEQNTSLHSISSIESSHFLVSEILNPKHYSID